MLFVLSLISDDSTGILNKPTASTKHHHRSKEDEQQPHSNKVIIAK